MAGPESEWPEIDGEFKVFIHQVVRENDIFLCGFLSLEERALFQQLIRVSGVGPAMGLQVLRQASSSSLVSDVVNGNVGGLTQLKGIGKKTAERIVLELRDKLKVEDHRVAVAVSRESLLYPGDALLALLALGLPQEQAQNRLEALAKTGLSSPSADAWVKGALRRD